MVNATSIAPLIAGAAMGSPDLKPDDPAKIRKAAQQFEALLLEEVMQSAKGSGGGWLESDGDSSEDCATGLGEQQLAIAIAQNGGLGLANMIAKGLEKK
jgi:Rod binding domain-containing protein